MTTYRSCEGVNNHYLNFFVQPQQTSDSSEVSEKTEIPVDWDYIYLQSFTDEDPSSFAYQIASGMVRCTC